MKSKFTCSLIILLFVGITGCKNTTTETFIVPEGLELNKGEKWIANNETHVGMKRIDSILNDITSLDGNILGGALSKETSYIIKSCNMKGEAHDQLHVVLVPILEEISELKDSKNQDEMEQRIAVLRHLVSTYFEYFKT